MVSFVHTCNLWEGQTNITDLARPNTPRIRTIAPTDFMKHWRDLEQLWEHTNALVTGASDEGSKALPGLPPLQFYTAMYGGLVAPQALYRCTVNAELIKTAAIPPGKKRSGKCPGRYYL